MTGNLEYEAIIEGARTPEQIHLKTMELLDMALAAKSRALKWFLFTKAGWKPDVERQRRVLREAVSADEEFSALCLQYLAIWNGEEEHVPKYVIPKPGSRVWTNRAESLEYWRKFLGGESLTPPSLSIALLKGPSIPQKYFAATADPAQGAFGILVGSWLIGVFPGAVGTAGYITHTKAGG